MEKYIIYLYLLFAVLFLSCTSDDVIETGSIHGVIKDFATSKLLENSIVTLNPSGTSLITGIDGSFEFNNLNAGQYEIIAKKDGYKDGKLSINVTPSKKIVKDILLEAKENCIKITPEIIDFGEVDYEKEMFLSNESNQNSIAYTIITDNEYIKVAPQEGTITNSASKIKIIIERDKFGLGNFEKLITINSQFGEVLVPVRFKNIIKNKASILLGEFDNIQSSSFQINVILNSTGGSTVTDFGVCFSENPTPTISDKKVSLGETKYISSQVAYVNGVMAGRTYYVRAYAQNSRGIAYSETKNITIPIIGSASVNTELATNVSPRSATLNGTITNTGGTEITGNGFYYGTDENITNKESVNSNESTFKLIINNLSPRTTYYYKAYVVNSIGESCGKVMKFTTLDLSSIMHVSRGGDDSNDGESWQTAKETFTDAIKNGQNIWIKAGQYKTGIYISSLSEQKNIYGGFKGNEENLDERDINKNITSIKYICNKSSKTVYIDGVTLDGENNYDYSAVEGDVVLTNCTIQNYNFIGRSIFTKIDEVKLTNCIINDCNTLFSDTRGKKLRFYNCTINFNHWDGHNTFYFNNSTLNGKYYEEYIIDYN